MPPVAFRSRWHTMTWFEDLTPYSYLPMFWDEAPPSRPALNVGWLAEGMRFATATPDPAFVERLRLLVRHARTQQTRGYHFCEFCPPARGEEWLRNEYLETHAGTAEIRAVGADATRYAAPTLIVHYVEAHRYAPPRAFVDAIMRCASLTLKAARAAALCLSCGARLETY